MTRKIIVVYNSLDAAMPNPQARLLRTQLSEVEAEMRVPGIRGRALDRLTTERKLLQSKLGQKDATPKSFWSYQASAETPSLAEAIQLKTISPNTTEEQWNTLSPGMKREIVRVARKKQTEQKDGVGTPEEQAYGEGWHSNENYCPYADPTLKASWEKGRAAKRSKFKMNSNARAGEVRGKRMEPPKVKVSADASLDYKSEKGFVAKLIDVQTGATLARSEPHISNGLGLKKWIQEEAEKLIKRGKRVKAEVAVVFFDPNMA